MPGGSKVPRALRSDPVPDPGPAGVTPASSSQELTMTFRETKLILFTADLAGFARATASMEALDVASFLDGWYRAIEPILARHGGRLVKFMGDSFLATFPDDACVAAVDAALELLRLDLRATTGLKVEVGVKIHLGTVA